MSSKPSAGVVVFRRTSGALEVLLVHPGGPLWQSKDLGVWSIPKGELDPGEEPLAAARRELAEETGFAPEGEFLPLRPITQKSGKVVTAFAIEADWDPSTLRSNTFSMPWPPHSGKTGTFPEVDRGAFFTLDEARRKANPAQVALFEELARIVEAGGREGAGR